MSCTFACFYDHMLGNHEVGREALDAWGDMRDVSHAINQLKALEPIPEKIRRLAKRD
jgi:hypothetical protein